jgi:superfamily II DNA or RNA helicase
MAATADYMEFLRRKTPMATARGLSASPKLSGHLFPFQKHCVEFLLHVGSGGLFLDTGLGKTLVQLEYAEHARNAANGMALILTPLAVAKQIEREAHRFGYPARVIRDQSEAREGINICNYDRLHLIDPSEFGIVTLDEASILKSFTGKTTRALISAFESHRWRVPATATPAPNDHMELGQYAEFCGVMQSNEMLSRFFINDTANASQSWRLKRHGVEAFWDWVASWCRLAQLPSDLGDSDDGFDLPPIAVHRHRAAESAPTMSGGLFGDEVVSATNLHQLKRATAGKRAMIAANLAMSDSHEPWVIWCDTDYEADAILDALGDAPGVVEVRGSHAPERKEANLEAFADGSARVMVTKPSVAGFGLNWQHCARTVFVGRSFSYESWYQAVRRFWRFGQAREVQVHLVVAEGEDSIARVIDRKAGDHASMKTAMRAAMARNKGKTSATRVAYQPNHKGKLPSWIA